MPRDSFANLWVWDQARARLPWYYAVATNQRPAKSLIAHRIPCDVELKRDTEETLWEEHDRGTRRFLETWKAIRAEALDLEDLAAEPPSLLDLSVELAHRMLRHCNFCQWNCNVDRAPGTKHGTCQLESTTRVSSYFHHPGEELVFRGTQGSGTIFFTSCNLRCSFCQNGNISQDKDNGIKITAKQLATAAWQLRMEGCHNINWVGGEPTIHLHTIVQAISHLARGEVDPGQLPYLSTAKADLPRRAILQENGLHHGEFNAPMLWNSNFFMSREAMRLLRPLIDVWLPDFKFGPGQCAIHLARTPWYWDTVTRNHRLIHDWAEDMVIRHLVMPDHVACCTEPVLEWIAAHTPRALVNVMDQYHPDSACDSRSRDYDPRYAAMARRPSDQEIRAAYDCAERLGLQFGDVTFEKTTRFPQPVLQW